MPALSFAPELGPQLRVRDAVRRRVLSGGFARVSSAAPIRYAANARDGEQAAFHPRSRGTTSGQRCRVHRDPEVIRSADDCASQINPDTGANNMHDSLGNGADMRSLGTLRNPRGFGVLAATSGFLRSSGHIPLVRGRYLDMSGERDQYLDTQQTQIDPAAKDQQDQKSVGVQKLQYMLRNGTPTPADVALEITKAPANQRSQMVNLLQTYYGNGYVQAVSQELKNIDQPAPADMVSTKPIGDATDPSLKGNALPDASLKQPADKIAGDDKPATYTGTETPVIGAPQPANTTLQDGSKRWAISDPMTTQGPSGPATTIQGDKVVDTNDLETYRKSVGAALDEQIKAAAPKGPDTAGDAAAFQARLQKEKDAVATADKGKLDDIVSHNKLLVAPPDKLVRADVTQTTQRGNAAGAFDPNVAMTQNNAKHTTVESDGRARTTTTDDSTRELSWKGLDRTDSKTTTVEDTKSGDAVSETKKSGWSGGGTDPLKYNRSKTTADTIGGETTQTNVNGGFQSGNGVGAVTVAASKNKVDEKGNQIGVEASAQLGVIQNDKGAGVTGGINDLRIGGGTTNVSAGAYGAADGSMQVSVTPAPDGSITIVLTTTVHGKLGGFLGKRDPKEPATSGTSFSGGGGIAGVGNKVVTRTRTFTAEEAKAKLAWLDGLASGVDERGHKTFGVQASEQVYSQLFGGHLSDLYKSEGVTPGEGETTSVQTEEGIAGDAKVGAGFGDTPGGRNGVNASINAEALALKGHEESSLPTGTMLKLMFGERQSIGGSAGGTVGSAGGSVSGSAMEQNTKTYVFSIPKEKKALLEEARALRDEVAVQKFAADHPDLVAGNVDGHAEALGFGVNANVGPVGIGGGSTGTQAEEVASGKQAAIGPDGRPYEQRTLSGTEDGERADNANVSLAGVKLAQGSDAAGTHGATDVNGQASFDLTEKKNESNAVGATEANLKAKDTSDIAAAGVTGGGPIGAVKALAERVGETDTVGAHFDDPAFRALCGQAGNFDTWMHAIGNQYRDEWAALRVQLLTPNPPPEWIGQDQASVGHLAAKTLMQMKSFATFMKKAGVEGKKAIDILRGEYTGNAIGITVSLPPSLSDRTKEFSKLTNQVEHLKQTLTPYAEAGKLEEGNVILDKLTGDLTAMKTAIEGAQDHDNPTLGVRAANGVADMIVKVADFKEKFVTSAEAAMTKKSKDEVDDALADHEKKSTTMIKQSDAAASDAWKKNQASTAPAMQTKSDAERAKASQEANEAQKKADDARAAENAQGDHEALEQANKTIPEFEARCGVVKGRAWQAADVVIHKDASFDKIMVVQNLLREWNQEWAKLRDAYKVAKKFVRLDLRAGLPADMIASMKASAAKESDNSVGAVGEIANQYTAFAWPASLSD